MAAIQCSPYALASTLVAHLQGVLADTRAGVADRVAVYPHPEPAVEFCPSMAWVAVRQVAPSNGRGTPPPGGCPPVTFLVDLTIGVQRCYPTTPDNGAPLAAAVDSAARDILDDAEAMRRAVRDAFDDLDYRVGVWRPVPPQGGSHGSRMEVSVLASPQVWVEPTSPQLPGDPRA